MPSARKRIVEENRSPLRKYGPTGAVVVIALIFASQNREEASFDFLWFNFTTPLWLILVIFTVLGNVMGWLVLRRRADD